MRGDTSVYRIYDAADALLYVGMTTDVKARVKQHVAYGACAGRYARHTSETFPTGREAAKAERAAIYHEAPLLNQRNNWKRWRLVGHTYVKVDGERWPADASGAIAKRMAETGETFNGLERAIGVNATAIQRAVSKGELSHLTPDQVLSVLKALWLKPIEVPA